VPVVLLVAALLTLLSAVRAQRRLAATSEPADTNPKTESRRNLSVS